MIEESATQDAAASIGTAYTISVGDSFEGVLSSGSDRDWVAVELVAGRSYDITLEGIGPDAVTDTVLTIYNADGKAVGVQRRHRVGSPGTLLHAGVHPR